VPLQGKRIFVTGGAGFIATTLARRLVDDNEIVALDNLHRDALSGTALAEHPNFSFHQADVLDLDAVTELARGATHIVHCAAIAGVDTVRESPVRTMRVNVIGTYQRSRPRFATLPDARALRRLLHERGLRDARVQRQRGPGLDDRQRRRGSLDVRGLEARRRAHGARLPRGARPADGDRAPFNVYGPGQIGGGAIRAFIEAALAGRDLVIHGDGSQIRAWCYVDDMVEARCSASSGPRRSARRSTSATRARR
jgi:UDP-glucose 4-epimerase